ncbi:MAG: hypothetical protein AAB338_02890 [Patescibacteria group bacterium]
MRNHTIEGWIDDHGQPIMQLQLLGLEDPVVALIDTGFNGELIIYEEHAHQAHLRIKPKASDITLADGSRAEFLISEGVIEWFGESRQTTIFVIPGPAPQKGRWQIGTQLLRDCRLEINFRERNVRLSREV